MNLGKEINDELFSGIVPDRVVKPSLTWKGSKIPFSVWGKMVALGVQVTAKHNAEVMCRLYYRPIDSVWDIIIHPQTLEAGLHITDTLDPQLEGGLLKQGFEPIGTMHTHASSPAFQSGTDSADELTSGNGLHITLGNLKDKDISVDFRYNYNGMFFKYSLLDWVMLPKEILSNPYKELLTEIILTRASVYSNINIPKKEMARIKKKPMPPIPPHSLEDYRIPTDGIYNSPGFGKPLSPYEEYYTFIDKLEVYTEGIVFPLSQREFDIGDNPNHIMDLQDRVLAKFPIISSEVMLNIERMIIDPSVWWAEELLCLLESYSDDSNGGLFSLLEDSINCNQRV